MKNKKWFKRITCILMATLMMAESICVQADGIGGHNGGVSFSNLVPVSNSPSITSSIVKTYPWKAKGTYPGYSNINFTGYRFYCIDNQENVVSTVFDLRYKPDNLGNIGRKYTSTYKESLDDTTAGKYRGHTLVDGESGPLAILRDNKAYGVEQEIKVGKEVKKVKDTSKYLSTAKEDKGIIDYVLNSSYATADEIDNALTSAVVNGNQTSGSNSNTQGTTTKSDGTTVVANTGDSSLNDLITRANNAINTGNGCSQIISEIINQYGVGVFSNSKIYSILSALIAKVGSNAAVAVLQKRFPSGLYSKDKKQAGYEYLISKGYSPQTAIVAVFKAKATSTGGIGGGTLTIAKEGSKEFEADELSQIIPTASGEDMSTDTSAIDDMFKTYMTFKDKQAQAYIDNGDYTPTAVMGLNNYTLVVEPLTWFRWANNEYERAAIGFKATAGFKITKDHKTDWMKNNVIVDKNTEGATLVVTQLEEATITYTWTYLGDDGNPQTFTVTQDVVENTDYTYDGNHINLQKCINFDSHKPNFTSYDGNAVYKWEKGPNGPAWNNTFGSYNGYTNYYALVKNSRYREDTKWTYGSLRDAIHYVVNKKNGKVNSQLEELIRIYLPAAMVVTNNIEFDNNVTFHGTAESDYSLTSGDLTDYSNKSSTHGYGMHMYQAATWFTKTRDDDKTTPGIQHRAPRPLNPDDYAETMGDIAIVKTYRIWDGPAIGSGNVISEQTYTRYQEPSSIYILNEETWTLSDWYISTRSSQLKDENNVDNTQGKWDSMNSEVRSSQSSDWNNYAETFGSSNTTGKPTEDKWQNNAVIPGADGNCRVTLDGNTPNTSTLYVLFEKCDINHEPEEADLTESEIYDVTSVDFKVDQPTFPGWPSTLAADGNTFSTTDNLTKYMIARGEDKITLKKFTGNNGGLNNGEGEATSNLMDNWYYGPEGSTSELHGYTAQYILNKPKTVFSPDNKVNNGNKEDKGKDKDKSDTEEEDPFEHITTDLTVAVYHGKKNVEEKREALDDTVNKSYHTRVKTGTLKLIPYYWMTVSKLDGSKQLRYVAGENRNRRTIGTYDYAEVKFKERGTIQVDSNMWATDSSFRTDTLKGGATFKVSTPSYAKVLATTHSMVWDDYDQNTGATNVVDIDLTDTSEPLSSVMANDRHDNFVQQLSQDIQDDFELTQYVVSGENSTPAGVKEDTSAPSHSVKATKGSNIIGLGTGSNTASNDSKYYLTTTNGDINNTALMETDILEKQSIYTRLFSLPNGNIYYVTGNTYDECDTKMREAMETARNSGGKYEVNKVCDKGNYNVDLAKGTKLIPNNDTITVGDAIEKSGALTALVNGIELNTGDDVNAPWCNGLSGDLSKTWYNEGAWVTVLTQQNNIDVGIINVKSRMLVLDPKLTPQQGKKNNDVKYNSSAFRVDWHGADRDGSAYMLGKFRGQNLLGEDGNGEAIGFKNLFGVSNTFYIPNRTVTDNK